LDWIGLDWIGLSLLEGDHIEFAVVHLFIVVWYDRLQLLLREE